MKAVHDARRADLAKIHIAKKQLQLDDETYRAMLWTIGRAHSSKDLDAGGRQAVLNHLRSRGFAPANGQANGKAPKRPRTGYPGRPHNIEGTPQLKKVEALLADAGRPWSYADSMAQRMFHVERVAWCTPEQLQKLIAALMIDQRRRTKERP